MCIQNLKTLALIEAKKYVTENLLGEKEKWTSKGIIRSSMLIFFYTIQQVISKICTKFQNPRHSSSWEIFDTNFPMYYIGVRWKKRKNGKRRQKLITASWFSFPQYTWPLSGCIQNLKTPAVIGAENSVTKCLIWEEEKWTYEGKDKQQQADPLSHNTTSHT